MLQSVLQLQYELQQYVLQGCRLAEIKSTLTFKGQKVFLFVLITLSDLKS